MTKTAVIVQPGRCVRHEGKRRMHPDLLMVGPEDLQAWTTSGDVVKALFVGIDLADLQAAKDEADRVAAEQAAKDEADRAAAEQAAKDEADRVAAEQAAKDEADRVAAEQDAKAEADRVAAEQAAKAEADQATRNQAPAAPRPGKPRKAS